jgi:hypothetical protein
VSHHRQPEPSTKAPARIDTQVVTALTVTGLQTGAVVSAQALPVSHFGAHWRCVCTASPWIQLRNSIRTSKADLPRPLINETFLEYAQARGFSVDPARAGHPKDKARVEADELPKLRPAPAQPYAEALTLAMLQGNQARVADQPW